MKSPSVVLLAALFSLSSISAAENSGWPAATADSSENPYIPAMPVSYACKIQAAYEQQDQPAQSVERETSFTSKDFENFGAALYEIKGAKPDVLDGQSFRLSFSKSKEGIENAELTVSARVLSAKAFISTSRTNVRPRSEGTISENATISVSPSSGESNTYSSMLVHAECTALP